MSKDLEEPHDRLPHPAAESAMEPTASGVFCSRIQNMVNAEDVNAIITAQRHMLDRFEKTNEMLLNFNNLSSTRLQQMNDRFVHHTRTLVEMKKDLDIIFRRIRMLKGKLAKQYPESFSRCTEVKIQESKGPIASLLNYHLLVSQIVQCVMKALRCFFRNSYQHGTLEDVHESPILEDDDDFDPTPKSSTTIATSEQSTESCDTSPSIISPTMSQEFEDLSQAPSDTPSVNGQLLTDDELAHED